MMKPSLTGLTLCGLCLLAACGDNKPRTDAPSDVMDPAVMDPTQQQAQGTDKPAAQSGESAAAAPYRTSMRQLVQWKRYAAVEADLMRALALSKDELCKELGDKNCVRDVHLVPLGGNEPYVAGLMRPSAEPLATTPPVIDRVLMSACSARARLDAAGPVRVFDALDFSAPLPAADDMAVTKTIVELYRRLLSRDPEVHEVDLVATLAEPAADADAPSPRDFATLACFTIGSTTEFLFF